MPTVKLVVIGASGVGKTSLRGQYVSGRFSNGYRATIGADFITKTMPHFNNPNESITLQIWDTAGQERFSSLSSAFFRGADAALLIFDVNEPETMQALRRWWGEFKERRPVADQDVEDYCCVVVGNKVDLAGVPNGSAGNGRGHGDIVTEAEALDFLEDLVPRSSTSPPPHDQQNGFSHSEEEEDDNEELSASQATIVPTTSKVEIPRVSLDSPSKSKHRTHSHSNSIELFAPSTPSNSVPSSHKLPRFRARSKSSTRFYGGTMTSTRSALSVYHTPSSSLFDAFESARASPEPSGSYRSRRESTHDPNYLSTSLRNRSRSESPESTRSPRRIPSFSSASSGSAVTITPRTFARQSKPNGNTPAPTTRPPLPALMSTPNSKRGASTTTDFAPPPPPPRRPKLFFTSAKTGEGVTDVFEYIAKRVVTRWEWEEAMEGRRMSVAEVGATGWAGSWGRGMGAAETVRLGLTSRMAKGRNGEERRRGSSCC